MRQNGVWTRTRRWWAVLALMPVLQVTACQNLDLSSAFNVGLANFAINQSTIAFDTIIRNLIGL